MIWGCMVMRLTPKGRVVRFFVSAISVSSRSGVMAPQAMTPKPPALEMAETRLRSEIQLIAPPMMATSQPRKSVPRFIRRFRRSRPTDWVAEIGREEGRGRGGEEVEYRVVAESRKKKN